MRARKFRWMTRTGSTRQSAAALAGRSPGRQKLFLATRPGGARSAAGNRTTVRSARRRRRPHEPAGARAVLQHAGGRWRVPTRSREGRAGEAAQALFKFPVGGNTEHGGQRGAGPPGRIRWNGATALQRDLRMCSRRKAAPRPHYRAAATPSRKPGSRAGPGKAGADVAAAAALQGRPAEPLAAHGRAAEDVVGGRGAASRTHAILLGSVEMK